MPSSWIGGSSVATVRDGGRAVLLVVDVQVGVMRAAWEQARVVRNVAHVVQRARIEGAPVVWVQHSDAELPHGSDGWQWVPELVPTEREEVIHKRFNSAFEETTLDAVLEQLGASHLVLAGAATNWCIRATAYAALDRGYDLTLVLDAHTTESAELEDGETLHARDIVRELNMVLRWLQYPGRRSAVATAAAVDFSPVRATP